jgi:hypothetical protein
MNKAQRFHPHGVIPAVLLPFFDDLSIAITQIDQLAAIAPDGRHI